MRDGVDLRGACATREMSSRACERGTHGCVVVHADACVLDGSRFPGETPCRFGNLLCNKSHVYGEGARDDDDR